MNTTAFPFRVWYHDNGHFVRNPRLAESVWRRIQNKRTWYAADYEVVSKNSIRLFVYCMLDSFHGGVGERVIDELITDLTKEEQKMLDEVILAEYTRLAEEEFELREESARKKRILEVRKELFGK